MSKRLAGFVFTVASDVEDSDLQLNLIIKVFEDSFDHYYYKSGNMTVPYRPPNTAQVREHFEHKKCYATVEPYGEGNHFLFLELRRALFPNALRFRSPWHFLQDEKLHVQESSSRNSY